MTDREGLLLARRRVVCSRLLLNTVFADNAYVHIIRIVSVY